MNEKARDSVSACPHRPAHTRRAARGCALVALALLLMVPAVRADELRLVVQSERGGAAATFSGFGELLSQLLGQTVRVELRANPLAHWRALVAGERPALVLEDPHFADYRVTRAGYRMVAALDRTQLFSIAVGGFLLLDPIELAGRPVAASPPPSLSTMQFLRFFSDPVRTPRLLESKSFEDAAEQVFEARAVAAVLPVEILHDFQGLRGIVTMEELPGKALLVSPDLEESVDQKLGTALLEAASRPAGRRLLDSLGARGFTRAHAEAYTGFAVMLRGSWGYRDLAP